MNTLMNLHYILRGLRCARLAVASFSPQPLFRAVRCLTVGLMCLGLTPGVFAPALHAAEKAAETGTATAGEPAAPASPSPALEGPTAEGTRELWTGKIYASTYRAGVCLKKNGTVWGVLLLTVPSGKVDVYHFYGRHENGRVSAKHTSGHTFEGQLENEQMVSGTIRLKSGFTVDLKGQRTHNVELTETCRPLPE